ncbi:MAG TPA: hypothetical protein VGT40_06535 [Methylomirabilota bacterium]|jgi:hypothetical protein|nr:hypothetical protein [Methylomirabilota bacterium]
MQVPVWVKPGVWGAVIGAVAAMIIGFSTLGWTLGSTAERMALERTSSAVVAALTPACVDSFMKQADSTKQLTGLRDIDSWKRQEVVEKGGWATMPGSKEATPGVASACAEALLKVKT